MLCDQTVTACTGSNPELRLPAEAYAFAIGAHLHSSALLGDSPITVAIGAMIGITRYKVKTLPVAYRAGTAWGTPTGIGHCALSLAVGATLIHYHMITPVANCITICQIRQLLITG
jgi:hypothetical protein